MSYRIEAGLDYRRKPANDTAVNVYTYALYYADNSGQIEDRLADWPKPPTRGEYEPLIKADQEARTAASRLTAAIQRIQILPPIPDSYVESEYDPAALRTD